MKRNESKLSSENDKSLSNWKKRGQAREEILENTKTFLNDVLKILKQYPWNLRKMLKIYFNLFIWTKHSGIDTTTKRVISHRHICSRFSYFKFYSLAGFERSKYIYAEIWFEKKFDNQFEQTCTKLTRNYWSTQNFKNKV